MTYNQIQKGNRTPEMDIAFENNYKISMIKDVGIPILTGMVGIGMAACNFLTGKNNYNQLQIQRNKYYNS